MKTWRMRVWTLATIAGTALTGAALGDEEAGDKAAEKPAAAPKVQLAILLDTSGSMQGLINQARTQLWKIVNELATAKRDGVAPHLEVALYEYGKSSIAADEGYLRQIVPLTDDLDKISEELFALSTNGGEEYCGRVIDAATRGLEWGEADKNLKMIFIAGNEPFTQGDVDSKTACKAAIEKGITISTIFCGPEQQGVDTGWKQGAELADGSFLSIDQNRAVAVIKTPFDEKLAELSGAVNKTYVAFGAADKRRALAARQRKQDRAAATAAPAAAAERADFKASGKYLASAWDLIDALEAKKVKLEDLKDEDLPEEMRKLSLEERKEYLAKKQAERKKIQDEIRDLADKRKTFIAEQRRKESAAEAGNTFDAALIKAVREQAARNQYTFENE